MRVNPFRPNSPVNPGMFVGRLDEITILEQALLQTRAGQPLHFMITGERGIGKTSLLFYLRRVAAGYIPIEKQTVNFLVVDLDLDSSTTQFGLMQRIQKEVDRQLRVSETAKKFLEDAWGFLQRVRIFDSGIEEKRVPDSDEVLLDEFAYTLARITDDH